jgi:endonuclease/exonuclease/phosphatase (EEP) superfamily protein YafD
MSQKELPRDAAFPPAPKPPRKLTARGLLLDGLGFLLLALAGVGTIAGFAAAQAWWLDLVCHFRVQYFWLLAVAAGLLAVRRRYWLAIVAAGLAVANLTEIAPLYRAPPAHQAVERPLRAMSLNLHWNNPAHQPTIDLIQAEKPDFICLLEITPEWVEALNPLESTYRHSEILDRKNSTGVALYSRFAIADVSLHYLPAVRLPTIVAGVLAPAGRLTILCTHPASPRSELDANYRNRQLLEVAQLAAQRSGPVMVLGDFNTTSWSPHFKKMLQVSGLRDSRLGFGVEPTWPSLPLPLRIPIDHCLVSPEIGVSNRRVGPDVGSDHRPILIDFSIAE